jgi:omega-amidase
MKVCCVQLDIAWENKPANHEKVRGMLAEKYFSRGSLVLLPEMFATGFSMNVAGVNDDATRADQRFLSAVAKEHGVYVVGGFVTTGAEGRGRNQAGVFDPGGREIARYTKLHCFTPGKEAQHYIAGREIVLFDWGGMKVCPFICYDLRFPEIFRRAVRMGAQMFVVIANWPLPRDEHWVTLLKARAIENQAYVAAVNRCGSDPWLAYPGRSMIVDPKGNVLADAGDREGMIEADVEAGVVAAWRGEFQALDDMRGEFLGG